jgi:hypothetical protein
MKKEIWKRENEENNISKEVTSASYGFNADIMKLGSTNGMTNQCLQCENCVEIKVQEVCNILGAAVILSRTGCLQFSLFTRLVK